MERKAIDLMSSDGIHIPGEFRLWEESPEDKERVRLELHFRDKVLTVDSQTDFFDALCEVRKHLELEGFRPLCLGATENVYPSPMSRSMGSGEWAYQLTLRQPALTEDLVSIFDTDSSIAPVSVEAQESYYRKWLESLK